VVGGRLSYGDQHAMIVLHLLSFSRNFWSIWLGCFYLEMPGSENKILGARGSHDSRHFHHLPLSFLLMSNIIMVNSVGWNII